MTWGSSDYLLLESFRAILEKDLLLLQCLGVFVIEVKYGDLILCCGHLWLHFFHFGDFFWTFQIGDI